MKNLALITTFLLAACGGDTHSHGGENCVADTTAITVTTAPDANQVADVAFDVAYMIQNSTGADLHMTQIRICDGADVADCGLGEQDSYSFVAATESDTQCMYNSSVTIDTEGSYTLVAFAHIGEDGIGEQGAQQSTPINIVVAAP